MAKLTTPDAVRWIVRTLEAAGFDTWTVGGAVRDTLAGLKSEDWDLATSAKPGEVQRLFPRTVPVGVEHGTVGVLARDGVLYEVTTFRRDVHTTGRHAVVAFAETLDEDLARRDFTINATAWHPLRETIHDPYGGQRDLEEGILRTVGHATDRFAEDYLRILRALRFAGMFQLRIEPATWKALTAGVERTKRLSAERLREELDKIFSAAAPPSRTLSLYAASGVTRVLYPEWSRLVGCPRDDAGDWFGHNLRTVDLLSSSRPVLRWAALFQGVGVPPEAGLGEEGLSGGDRAAYRAAALLTRLKSSNARTRIVATLARWVSEPPDPRSPDPDLRRWMEAVGSEAATPLLRIWMATARSDACRKGSGVQIARIRNLIQRVRRIRLSGAPLALGDLAFTGRDLVRMGYAPGPEFGDVLRHLLDRVLEDPEMNHPEHLADEVTRWFASRRSDPSGRSSQSGDDAGGG